MKIYVKRETRVHWKFSARASFQKKYEFESIILWVEVKPSLLQQSIYYFICFKLQPDKMVTGMKARTKKKVQKNASVDIHRRLLNDYADETVDASTVRQWAMRFSSNNSGLCNKFWAVLPSCYLMKWKKTSKIHSE